MDVSLSFVHCFLGYCSLNGDQSCDVGISVYMSGASSALYFCASLFLCCFPTPDPLFGKRTPKKRPTAREPNVIVQPIVIDQTGGHLQKNDNDEYDDEEEDPPVPRKTSSMISRKNADKITDDDFDFEVPRDDADRVDYREITLPDGTRQVHETTYHSDGTKSTKTRMYD